MYVNWFVWKLLMKSSNKAVKEDVIYDAICNNRSMKHVQW